MYIVPHRNEGNEQMNHPSWQQKLREHQAKYDAQLAAARAQLEAEEQEKLQKKVNEFRADMAVIGLDLPESDTGEWMLDGYVLNMYPSRVMANRFDLRIEVYASVQMPFGLNDEMEFDLYENGYQKCVSRVVYVRMNDVMGTASEIAKAFDELPGEANVMRQKNLQIAIQVLAPDEDEEGDLSEVIESPVNEKPSTDALLAEVVGYIREIAEAARKLSAVNHG